VKCGVCYADNPAWQNVCSACGSPTRHLQLCPAGRLLAAGQTKCADCPATWPEVTSFGGHPLLRGVLWLDGGSLESEDGARTLPYVELRDQEPPVAFSVLGPQHVRVLAGDPVEASVKLLVRPGGTQYCVPPTDGSLACAGLSYGPLPATERLVVAGATLRVAFFEVPEWVEPRR
jgi:hypothetical protein